MKCRRCHQEKEVKYRVYSDLLNMKVCEDCAVEARELHLGVELLTSEQSLPPQTEEHMRRAS